MDKNFVQKEENAGYKHFLLFPDVIESFILVFFKVRDCFVKGCKVFYSTLNIISAISEQQIHAFP